MKYGIIGAAFAAGAVLLAGAAAAQQKTADRLYILNCGEGVAGDIARWTPGATGPRDFVDNCYLIRHGQDWLLWDTGVPDSVADMPEGLPPPDPAATRWKRPKKLLAQLAELGVKPGDLKYVAVSHSHPDHIGNVELFPQTMLLVQKAEHEWPAPLGMRFKAEHPATKLTGDHDVFGDGSVVLLSTPGHTPGHQSLLVRLPKTGALVLSGDAVHFRSNWDNRVTPTMNTDPGATQASLQKIADTLAKEKAQLWINHDKPQRDSLKMAPEYYD
ncbi:MAG: N-acyl homoserine lactonase family protein [Beijerinckiaceae bacterium]